MSEGLDAINGGRSLSAPPIHKALERRRRRIAGWTAIELAIVLAIIAALAAAWEFYISPLLSKKKYAQFMNDSMLVMSQTSTFYNGDFGTGAIDPATLIAAKAIPESVVKNGVLENAFGGSIELIGNGSTAFFNQDGIPQSWCINWVSGLPATSSILGVSVASSLSSLGPPTFAPPVTKAEAVAACSNSDNAISVEFR